MAQVTKDVPLSFGDPKKTVNGYVLVNTENGDMEWFRHGDSYPTFSSNKSDGYKWKPSTDSSIDNLAGRPEFFAGIGAGNDTNSKEAIANEIEDQLSNTQSQTVQDLNNIRTQQIEDNGSQEEREELLVNPDTAVPGAATLSDSVDALSNITIQGGADTLFNDENYSGLRYPNDIDLDTQDCVSITILKYGKKDFNVGGGNIGFTNRNFEIGNTIILPIQAGIKDQNMVKWSGQETGALQTALGGIADKVSDGDIEGAAKAGGDALRKAGVSDAIITTLLQKASGAQGLLSRLTGAIANPNLELLFQGPELRPFSLSFFMSPRDEAEATTVRKIIRALKQSMAVKRGANGIFLKAPDIFRVKYMQAGGFEHGAINRFKECALLQMSVDYTPGGTYSTFNDGKKTMTAYRVDLSFQELEPVFADEYKEGYPTGSTASPAFDEIGY